MTRFHPAVSAWFEKAFEGPTPPQRDAWPAIKRGEDVLIAAPTGSGKTLAAFLACIDDLVQEAVDGDATGLPEEVRVLYVSPLKALSTDIRENLGEPLAGIETVLEERGARTAGITVASRTGDTTTAERNRMKRSPPHILVTTPESLFILLTSDSGRTMLSTVRSVIVDEIHAMAGSKRGAHLLLSLARLDALVGERPRRVGLSATQKPIDAMARFLNHGHPCTVVDSGHVRHRDLALVVPASPLAPVLANEVWEEIYARLEALIQDHGTTLIFVNTRRLAERAARHLAERLGEDAVTAHHGSLAKEHRLDAETRLKQGRLRALVATASLELGIDIGDVDLVCQLGSPRSIAGLLQRVGRSGHAVAATPKGRLFPLSRDDLVECVALLDAVRREELDEITIPRAPLDVLAQQIIAEVAAREWDERELFECFTSVYSYAELDFDRFRAVAAMLAEGFATQQGRRSAYLYRDGVHGRLRARKSARLTALSNAGTIPDQFDYEVVLRPRDVRVGTLNEDFAFESMPGDVFQLGNAAYQVLKVESGKVFVQDAGGMAPTLPFWIGEAPGRTDELSFAVSRLRSAFDEKLATGRADALDLARDEFGLPDAAAEQLVDHLGKASAALGGLPTQDRIVLERFFDESGDMHLVIHSTFGSRINRALGLSLRKRFCRKFNFELQAAALEDSVVLSLGPTHSFPLDEVLGYLRAETVRDVLIQALLAAPMFGARWRWVTTTSLAVRRMANGARRPPQFQRNDAEDLVAVCFPDQLACLENVAGPREVPEHPLVDQAIDDCLHEVMDVDGLVDLLRRVEAGSIAVVGRDLSSPSPIAWEILNARPYAFLDDGAAEERRTLAVANRQHMSWEEAGSLASLDPEVVARVTREAWPAAREPDELHDALLVAGFLTVEEVAEHGWLADMERLVEDTRSHLVAAKGHGLWFAAERFHEAVALFELDSAGTLHAVVERDTALVELLRSRLGVVGPVTPTELSASTGVPQAHIDQALLTLEQQGVAIRGIEGGDRWCDRSLLARIHRATLERRRQHFRPVDPATFMRFLFDWHDLNAPIGEGRAALEQALGLLTGWSAPAAVWEGDLLASRLARYRAHELEDLCASGRISWLRLAPPTAFRFSSTGVSQIPIALLPRREVRFWAPALPELALSSSAERLRALLAEGGAQFADDLRQQSRLLDEPFEHALAELVALGVVHSDNYLGIRTIGAVSKVRAARERYRRRGIPVPTLDDGGRWSLVPRADDSVDRWERAEVIARAMLRRYGVVFRMLLEREQGLPPWRDLLYVLRRLEARDEIRGGRFVDGFAGEQFALPQAAVALNQLRKVEAEGRVQAVAAYDPLNLRGVLEPGDRVPAHAGNRVAYVAGAGVAALVSGAIEGFATAPVDDPVAHALDPTTRFGRRKR
ncbi:MAG: DEAD/DEAH box helicase [Pseudomonadota bacterium]